MPHGIKIQADSTDGEVQSLKKLQFQVQVTRAEGLRADLEEIKAI